MEKYANNMNNYTLEDPDNTKNNSPLNNHITFFINFH